MISSINYTTLLGNREQQSASDKNTTSHIKAKAEYIKKTSTNSHSMT